MSAARAVNFDEIDKTLATEELGASIYSSIDTHLSSPALHQEVDRESPVDLEQESIAPAQLSALKQPSGAANGGTETKFSFRQEFSELWQLAWPICTFQFLAYLMTMVDLAMVGSLGANELAAAGLANVMFNLLNHLMAGCATAFDTLFAQTLGKGELQLYGKWLAAGTAVMTVLCVPMAAVLASTEYILVGLHQDPDLAAQAGEYCRLLIPGLIPLYCFLALTRYLQVQKILLPSIAIGIIANVLNAGLNYALIYEPLGLGYAGGPIATTISRWVQLLLMLSYLWCAQKGHNKTWPATFCTDEFGRLAKTFLALGGWREGCAVDMRSMVALWIFPSKVQTHHPIPT
jgi:Na+-driven multidrug efflux pump